MQCYNCENIIFHTDKICDKCGKDISDEKADDILVSNNNNNDWTVIKLTAIITSILAIVFFSVYFVCCEDSKDTIQDKEKITKDKIWMTMIKKAKISSYNPETYKFISQKDYKLNDSVSLYVQRFSSKNDYGVTKQAVVMSFFNSKEGYELTGPELNAMASENEIQLALYKMND